MALLSEKKVLMFNPSLTALMDRLLEKGWNNQDQQASFAAFVLDKMHFELDPEARPYQDLAALFQTVRQDRETELEFADGLRSQNFFRQYRICVTPSLVRYTRGQEEESNRVIRQFKTNLHSFIRLNFMDDKNGKGYYSADGAQSILGYLHKILQHGVWLGNAEYRFLSYSNSQLKSHACWFLCRSEALTQVSEASIESCMGDFSKEKNVLKKFARKGQCFSSSKHVCIMQPDEVTFGVQDIERNGFTFTDGVGYISPALA